MIKRHMRCSINPAVGDERFIHLPPAIQTFDVAVVGGGPRRAWKRPASPPCAAIA